jgi:sterol desaturase/sphingolipid hydroxylase (fatty acid hydroxylase superfamily)
MEFLDYLTSREFLTSWEFYSPAITVTSALILITLERIFPYEPKQGLFRDGFWNDLGMYSIVQSFVLGYIIAAITQFIDSGTGLSRLAIISAWPIWAQVLLSLFVHDLYIYWFHRWQHRNKFLWRVHEAHHSTLDVDWLSGSRSHSLEILINQTIEFAPLILLGAAPETIAIKTALDAVWGMYIHSNIDVRSGWLQYVINGPEMHRWHHAVDHDAHNRNFGTKFAMWDWLFGTAFFPNPKVRKPTGYGLDAYFPKNYFVQHAFAFRKFEEEQEAEKPVEQKEQVVVGRGDVMEAE